MMIPFRRGLLAGALVAAVMTGVTASQDAAAAAANGRRAMKQSVPAQQCSIRPRGHLVDVDCPKATLAGVLQAFEKSFGLRGEYPRELGALQISVRVRRSTPDDALRTALARFNFAVFRDANMPSITWVRVVGARTDVWQQNPQLVDARSSLRAAARPAERRAVIAARTAVREEAAGLAIGSGTGQFQMAEDKNVHKPAEMPVSETVEAPASLFDGAKGGSARSVKAAFSDVAARPASLVAVPVDPQLGPTLLTTPQE
jgi:hypothetical protein